MGLNALFCCLNLKISTEDLSPALDYVLQVYQQMPSLLLNPRTSKYPFITYKLTGSKRILS